ncbi:DotH/IcmK family type IV secretion protein [Thiotrichales bacterium 19S9-12]|nr:DotH/IcmK family type IV secretion protein [Thiotrichales bacterium 19S9-11]MCF6812149.1 DotH/IcmK family type IV secretion protein [Thiotrichales bacterium 19S9-12]
MKKITALLAFLGVSGFAYANATGTPNGKDLTADVAFDSITSQAFPLSPDQIEAVKGMVESRQKASASAPGISNQESASRTLTVSLDPTKRFVPPVVRIGVGMITSVIFTDANGSVWPITQYSIGDSKSYNVMWQQKGGVLMIQGLKPFKQTNMAVMLDGLQIPVMVTLVTGQNEWDYMDYIRVQAKAGAKGQMAQAVEQAPKYLTDLLAGLPPKGAVAMKVSGASDVRVWRYGGKYLVLTPSDLISPAWGSKAQDNGMIKMHAYEISQTPYLILSNNDQVEHVTVSSAGNDS